MRWEACRQARTAHMPSLSPPSSVLRPRSAGLSVAVADRLGWETRPVLDAAKAFFLRSGNY